MTAPLSSRRTFILQGACAALGVAAAPLAIASVQVTSPGALTAASFASRYSRSVEIVGASAVASLAGGEPAVLHLRANVNDPAALTAALGQMDQLGTVFARGNTLFITAPDGSRCELENVIGTPAPAELAHEAVAADTTGTVRTDRVAVFDGTIKLARRPRGLVAAFDTILRGIRDAAELGLPEHASFTRLKNGILRVSRVMPATARGVAASFLSHATALADALPAAAMAALANSPIITASLRRATGGTQHSAAVMQWAPRPDPAQVLAWMLGAERIAQPDALTAAVTSSPEYFRARRSREALAEAARFAGPR